MVKAQPQEPDPSKVERLRSAAYASDRAQIAYAISMLDDADIRVRGEAFCSLILNRNKIADHLKAALSHPSSNIRSFCALVLANRGDSEAAPRIAPLVEDSNPAVRSCALGSLGRLRYSDAARSIRVCLSDDNPEVQRSALKAALDLDLEISGPVRRRLSADPSLRAMLAGIR